MEWRSALASFVVVLLVSFGLDAQDDMDDDPCNDASSQLSCDMCISASYRCSWCPYFPNVTVPELRCRLATDPPSSCPGDVTEENPSAETLTTRDENLTTSDTQRDGVRAIQVSPQNVSMSLRRGEPSSFEMTFRSLRNTPLDLYFLIDFSSSQNIVIDTLQEFLTDIGDVVAENVSSNFQMGFGSFVDKPILPYALNNYMRNISGEIECRGFSECVPTYSFTNSQPLTSNIMELAITFNATSELSSNIDSPEGSLEALLQVAVCTNETGWRSDALRMVFLITDQGYHSAGDGKLGGIVTPNDGLCHQEVGESGQLEYTHSLLQDYPSLFQIRTALETNLIVPIFALRTSFISAARVASSLVPTYNMLVADLSATGAQSTVFNDSVMDGGDLAGFDEIIRVIQESYETTVQNIRVNIPSVPGYSFSIDPIEGCMDRSDDGSCLLQFDEEVTFRVTVTLDDCTEAVSRRVQLLGPPFSFTTIDLEPLCRCNCSENELEVDSALCTSRGNLECGLCDCGPFFGDQCECAEEVTECPSDLGDILGTCSNRGICSSCGTCRCFNGSFGDACQCTASSCDPRCSDRGECTCNETNSIPTCRCERAPLSGVRFFEGVVGNPGSCLCNPDDCFNPAFPNELCHINTSSTATNNTDGRVYCRCGGCECEGLPGFVTDNDRNVCRLQEECTDEIERCARCRLNDIDNTTATCGNCPQNITFLGEDVEGTGFTRSCNYRIGNCNYRFFLSFGNAMLSLTFTRLGCTNQALPWIITGSLVGAIILLGLLFLIILKLLLLAWDRHEYKKFTQELKDADFAPMDNPLYLTPQQDYQNPLRRPTKRVQPQE